MKTIIQGENISLLQAEISGNNIFSGISWSVDGDKRIEIDICAFLLDSSNKVGDDGDFVFYNQKEDGAKSIRLNTDPGNGNDIQLFSIRLDKIPPRVKKIVFVASIDKAVERSQNFGNVKDMCIRIFELDAFDDKTIVFKPVHAERETSIALGELYLHQSGWKFRGLGNGFESGLDALALSYGINVASVPNAEESSLEMNSSERFADQAGAENEVHIKKHIDRIIPKIKNAVDQNINESSTRMLLDKVFMEILGYKMEEVKVEVKIQGRRADYVLAVDDRDVLIVEAKRAGLPLKDGHIFQACSYAAYSGIKFVLLTNLCEFILFKVKTKDVVESEPIFSVDLLNDLDAVGIKNLALISRLGMTESKPLEILSEQVIASSPSNISRILLNIEVIDKIKEIIKKEQNCDVLQEQIQETIEILLRI